MAGVVGDGQSDFDDRLLPLVEAQGRVIQPDENPATGEPIKIPAKTVVKARIAKKLKDAVLPRK